MQQVSSQYLFARRATAAGFFLHGFTFSSWASRIPQVQKQLNLSDQELGLVLFSLPVGLLVTLFFSGYMVSRFGSRRILLVATTTYAIMLLAIGMAASVLQLVVVLFLFGLVANMGNIAINTQAIAVQAGYRGQIMGTFHGVWSLAGFTGAGFSMLILHVGAGLVLHFGIVLAVVVAGMWTIKNYLLDTDPGVSADKPPLFVRPDRWLLLLGLTGMFCLLCEGAMFDWSGIFFIRVVHPGKALEPLGFVCYMAAMSAGRFLSDFAINRFGAGKVLPASGLMIFLGLMLAVVFPHFLTAMLGFMATGLGVASIVPQVYARAGTHPRVAPGLALAAVSSIGNFGFMFGPPVIGFLAEAYSLRVAFGVVALLGLATSICSRQALLSKPEMH